MRAVFSKDVPRQVPAVEVEREDMARVTVEDLDALRDLARRYCRKVDATRSRKRTDRSATVAHGLYGTDDTSDDTVRRPSVVGFDRGLS